MYLALPLVVVCTALLGFLIERAAYKPLRSAPRMSLMISAIGVSYLHQNLAFYLTGGLPKPVTNPIPGSLIRSASSAHPPSASRSSPRC